MRKFAYILLGLILLAGSGTILVKRQLRLADDDGRPQASAPATRSVTRDPGAGAAPVARTQRKIDRGIEQYRSPQGGWKLFEAVIDVLNVVVGVVGIGLAVTGMRRR